MPWIAASSISASWPASDRDAVAKHEITDVRTLFFYLCVNSFCNLYYNFVLCFVWQSLLGNPGVVNSVYCKMQINCYKHLVLWCCWLGDGKVSRPVPTVGKSLLLRDPAWLRKNCSIKQTLTVIVAVSTSAASGVVFAFQVTQIYSAHIVCKKQS